MNTRIPGRRVPAPSSTLDRTSAQAVLADALNNREDVMRAAGADARERARAARLRKASQQPGEGLTA